MRIPLFLFLSPLLARIHQICIYAFSFHPPMQSDTCMYVRFLHLKSKAKAVVYNWYTTLWFAEIFLLFQLEFIMNNRSKHQQLWNVIFIGVIVLYFWIYNVVLNAIL